MAVRSAQLAAGSMSAAGYHTGFVVPAGWTYLVKHVTVSNNGGSNTGLRMWGGWAGKALLLGYTSTAPGTISQYPMWLAMAAGAEVFWQLLFDVETHVWVSGTQLPGAQQFPSAPPALRFG